MIPSFGSMRLRLAEILDENAQRDREPATAYQLAKLSAGRLSMSAAARLVRDEWRCLPREVLETLCDVLGVEPCELFSREGAKPSRTGRAAKRR